MRVPAASLALFESTESHLACTLHMRPQYVDCTESFVDTHHGSFVPPCGLGSFLYDSLPLAPCWMPGIQRIQKLTRSGAHHVFKFAGDAIPHLPWGHLSLVEFPAVHLAVALLMPLPFPRVQGLVPKDTIERH